MQWAKAKERAQKKMRLRYLLEKTQNVVRLSRFSLFHHYYRIVDIDGYLQQRIRSEKLPVRILKKRGESPFERLIIRVRPRNDETVKQLAESAKQYCVQQLCEVYASVCKNGV